MLELKVKYLVDDMPKLKPSIKEDGNEWIDVYAAEDMFIAYKEQRLIPLGFCLEMPKGYEAVLAPRSSTFKTWGIIFANSFGVIDNKYKGNNDQWMINAFCLKEDSKNSTVFGYGDTKIIGTTIHKGDKIGQFRIRECMPTVNIVEVDSLGNEDRGGFGSTGTK